MRFVICLMFAAMGAVGAQANSVYVDLSGEWKDSGSQIAPGVQYSDFVTRGEQFTLVSDGVVEAENANRELFGFERTREISGKSALEIAERAEAWGQNDDITVVTVRRT